MSIVTIENRIKLLEERINKYILSKGNLLDSEYDEIIDEYEEISLDLINQDNLPDSVAKFISCDYSLKNKIPQEYVGILSILNLGEYSYKIAKKEIEKSKKMKNFSIGIKFLLQSIKASPLNVSLLYQFESQFKKGKLYSELLELYKVIFAHTYDPVSCEKMGDVYFTLKEYEKSIEYYLNYAELAGTNSNIYLKLAKAFNKTGDIDSYNACIEQAKRIDNGE